MSNVAYDFFISSTPGGQAQYEIMIWLAKYEAEAISFIYSADSEPTGISTVTLAGQKWCAISLCSIPHLPLLWNAGLYFMVGTETTSSIHTFHLLALRLRTSAAN
jgi:hypothetical protein